MAGETSASDNGKRILVVDDETDLLELLTRTLQGVGYQVDATGDGEMALAYLAKTEYNLIICDVRIPGTSGPEIYRKVQEQNSDLARRFIFITGDSVSPATHRFLEETGTTFLCKPFGPTDLIQKINGMLEAGSG
jgi:two-component system NtrC family sensor kinase